MRNRLLACLLCLACSLGSAHPIDVAASAHQVAPAYDDDQLMDNYQQHVAIADRDTVPLLVIGALWIAFLAGLGIARWRERSGSKIVE